MTSRKKAFGDTFADAYVARMGAAPTQHQFSQTKIEVVVLDARLSHQAFMQSICFAVSASECENDAILCYGMCGAVVVLVRKLLGRQVEKS